MVKRNPHFSKLSESYLFPEVMRRVHMFKEKTPHAEVISLSIGDTSEPLPPIVTEGFKQRALQLGTRSGYTGYGPEQGEQGLREKIAKTLYSHRISADEIFVSDGAKCDIGRLQLLFGADVRIAVQDPTYPVYVDTSTLIGSQSIVYLPCTSENDFFPDVATLPPVDLLYICSPNNPTGSVATKEQLKTIVKWAKEKRAVIIYDAAYSGFIQGPDLPRSIYEIEGAHEVAIEVNSFSKLAGFTGVRLGWTVIPKALRFENKESIHQDYTRLVTTFFNGASTLSQAGAYAALSTQGQEDMQKTIAFYLENARLIREALKPKGLSIYGGQHAPYLWMHFGQKDSWALFQKLLEETHLIATPGSGFGQSGEGFLRFSAFGSRAHILKAIERIETKWPNTMQ